MSYDGANLAMTVTDASTAATYTKTWAMDIPGHRLEYRLCRLQWLHGRVYRIAKNADLDDEQRRYHWNGGYTHF